MKKTYIVAFLTIGLIALVAANFVPGKYETKTIPVFNVHCSNCVDEIESTLKKVNGIQNASVNMKDSSVEIEYDPSTITINGVQETLVALGYGSEKGSSHTNEESIGKSNCDDKKSGKDNCCSTKSKKSASGSNQ